MTNFYTHFEMCSLMFLLLLMYYFFRSRRVNTPSMHIYAFYLVLAYIVMLLDILSVVFLSSELVNVVFLASQVLMAPIYLLYVLSLVDRVSHRYRRGLFFAFLPAVLMFLTVLSNHWTNVIFIIDAEGRYYHGQLHFVMYVVAALYMIAAQFSALRWHKLLDTNKKYTIGFITLLLGALMVLQLMLKSYLLVGTGVVLGQYMMYHTFQNPVDYLDAPTKLLNRQALLTTLRRQLAMGRPFRLLVVSMRSFKSVNDVFGIAAGDQLLATVGARLSDICGENNTYRFVGDEFVVLLKGDGQNDARLIQIQQCFQQPWRLNGLTIRPAADLCLIGSEYCNSDSEELVKLIDFAVIEAKQRRLDGWNVMDDRVSAAMRRNVAIEQGLTKALEANALEMHFQPILAVKTGGYPTFEALARLRLDDIGYVPPDEFIRLAERNGTIVRLGEVIIESVCRFLRDEKPERYGVELAQINLSVVQCMDEDFARRCAEIIAKYGVDPGSICLEITETAASYSDAALLHNMDALHELGVAFALDDYGSGYSTADYVMRMPFSHVKLDKNLVSDAAVSERSRLLMSSLCEMFSKMGFQVVAEGIETQHEADMLIGCGAEYLQGYLYSKPLPAQEYMEFLREKADKPLDECGPALAPAPYAYT